MENPLEQILITGASGMVGNYIDFGTSLDHRALDVTNSEEVGRAIEYYKPRVIVHLAAETDVDRCEREPEHAFFVNGVGTWNMALAAKKSGARLIYVSTVYVFDGLKHSPYEETDVPSPLNFYGQSKYMGEMLIQELLRDYSILRSGWMFGGGPERDRKFVGKIMRQLDQAEIKAVDNILGSLTYAKDLAAKIKTVAVMEHPPRIMHVGNEGFCSRYDVAVEIAKAAEKIIKITPVDSSYFKLDASRSHSDRMISACGGTLRPWRGALQDYIHNEWTKKH
ncbi:MAG: NAD(P)-dependent oxidoreductase [Patescibacteria group bacterium]|nr:NAD(P)-dependent oxidoreductase [Patescibacteria group bacterium]